MRRNLPRDPVLFGIGAGLFAVGCGALLFVGRVVQLGRMDTRPRHAPASESTYLYASEEPLAFYLLVFLLAATAAFAAVHGWRMLRSGSQGRLVNSSSEKLVDTLGAERCGKTRS
jgi:hypothetical protein